jgi:hypothetical protein
MVPNNFVGKDNKIFLKSSYQNHLYIVMNYYNYSYANYRGGK